MKRTRLLTIGFVLIVLTLSMGATLHAATPKSVIAANPSIEDDVAACQTIVNAFEDLTPFTNAKARDAFVAGEKQSCAVFGKVYNYCQTPLEPSVEVASSAEISIVGKSVMKAKMAKKLATQGAFCPSAKSVRDAEENAKMHPVSAQGPGLGSLRWQNMVLQGVAGFVSARLEAELTLALQENLLDKMCKGDKNKQVRILLPKTCKLVDELNKSAHAARAWGLIKATIEDDFAQFPENIIKAMGKEEKVNKHVVDFSSVVLGVVRELEDGKDGYDALVGATDKYDLEADCAAMGPKCAAVVLNLTLKIVKGQSVKADDDKFAEMALRLLYQIAENNPNFKNALALKLDDDGDVEYRKAAIVDLADKILALKPLLTKANGAKDSPEEFAQYYSEYLRGILPVISAGTRIAMGASFDAGKCNPEGQSAACIKKGIEVADQFLTLVDQVRVRDYSGMLVSAISIYKEMVPADKESVILNESLFFAIELAGAEDAESVQNVVENAAAPVGSYKAKRGSNNSGYVLSLTALPGMQGGVEFVTGKSLPDAGRAWRMGLAAPIGIDLSFRMGKYSSIGVFFSIIDLGALVDFRLSNKEIKKSGTTTEVEAEPEVGFAQVVSPGVFLNFGLGKSPLTLGLGCSYTPELRKASIAETDEDFNMSALRLSAFLGVDITILPIAR